MQNIVLLVLISSSVAFVTAQDDKPPRFSIGLGTLSPGYSQKLPGNGRLDVDQDKNGFSYTLNNMVHPSSSSSGQIDYRPQSSQQKFQSASNQNTGSRYGQLQSAPQSPAQFSIYHHRQAPPQPTPSQAPLYQSQSEQEYQEPEHQTYNQQHSRQQQQYQQQPEQYQPSQQFSDRQLPSHQNSQSQPQHQSYVQPQQRQQLSQSEPENDYQSNQPNSGDDSGRPVFTPYDFEQKIQHMFKPEPQVQHQSQNQPRYQTQQQHKSFEPTFGYNRKN